MKKLLVIGALGLIALLVVIWWQLHATVEAAPAVAARAPQVATRMMALPVVPRAVAPAVAPAPPAPGKLDPGSDEFFNMFTERVPVFTSKAAMSCYHRGLRRRTMDQSITLTFVDHIKDGEVTVSDVKVKRSTLGDMQLEACMIDAVAHTHWHDDTLPDVTQDDEVAITPERGGKKYMDDDYVGPEAPPNTPR